MFIGKTIINTRPKGSEDHIGIALKDLGARVLNMQLIEIIPIPVSKKTLKGLTKNNTYQWLIFTSKNGVNHLFDQIKFDTRIKTLPFKTAVFGKRTALALKKRGFKPDIVNLQNTAADLLNDLYRKININDKLLLVLGHLASDLMENSLKSRVSVERLNVYKTIFAKSINDEILSTIEHDNYDLILFNSPSGFNSFKYHANKSINLNKLKIACIGPTTEEVILNEGINPLVVAKPSGKEGLIKEIRNYFNTPSLEEVNY